MPSSDPTIPDSAFSDADVDSILTDEDIRQRSQALDDTQTIWEKVAYLAMPKMPCPECGGTGTVHSGSFSDLCVNCEGSRVVSAPDADDDFRMPDFASMRRAIGAYGDALIDRGLPDGHKGKRQLALPAGATVPTVAAINELRAQGKAEMTKLRQLTSGAEHGRGVDARQLPQGKPARGLAGEGDLGDYEDAELAEMEDAATDVGGRPRGKR